VVSGNFRKAPVLASSGTESVRDSDFLRFREAPVRFREAPVRFREASIRFRKASIRFLRASVFPRASAHDWDVAVTESDAGGARFEGRTEPTAGGEGERKTHTATLTKRLYESVL